MKEEKNNWTKSLRDRLADYEEPLPVDGWNRLEEELVAPIKIRYPYRRMAIAAAILLLLISSVCVYFLNSPASDYMKNTQASLPVITTEPMEEPKQADPVKTIEPAKPSGKVAQVHREVSQIKEAVPTVIEEEQPIAETEPIENKQEELKQKESAEKETPQTSVVEKRPSSYTFSRTEEQLSRTRKRNTKEKNWSVGVSVGNGLLASNNVNPGFGKLSKATMKGDLPSYDSSPSIGQSDYLLLGTMDAISNKPEAVEAYRQVVYNNFTKEATTDVKHHMPVTVGASVRFALSKQFAIETGLNYTLLSSDLKAGKNSHYVQEQKLHYLGIPVKGSWMFFDKKYISLYLSAGGAMEKSVSGKLKNTYIVEGKDVETESSDLDVKPLQWSVTSAVGVQYNATKHLGIYLEPGVSYYFDDGSDVQTIRKEKPFNFNLQLGFRVSY